MKRVTRSIFFYFFLFPILAYTQADLASVTASNSQSSFNASPKTNFTRVPFESVHGMILVQAEMEGRKGSFILDTGAPTLIVNEEAPNGNAEEVLSISGDFEVQTIQVDHFAWAGIEKSGIEALALDISHLEETYQREILGVIGYQIFSDREILIDGSRMQIIIFNGKNNELSRIGQPMSSLPFTMENHLPVLKTKIGNNTYNFGFDSGCSANLLAQRVLDELPGETFQILKYQKVQGFDQQIQEVPLVYTNAVEFGSLTSGGMEYLVTDLSHLQDSDLRIDGLLGYPFFKNLTFSINYAKRKLSIWKVHSNQKLPLP